MKKLNTKGITLVELIISMSILGVVLTIGYGIINGSSRSIKEQSNVFSGQMSINTVNTFITKDLEQSKKLEGPKKDELQELVNKVDINNSQQYVYKIETNDGKEVEYEVNVSKDIKSNKYKYDIERKETVDSNSQAIEISYNQPIATDNGNLEIPFIIEYKGKNYYIELGYEYKGKQNRYKFSVSSRYL